MMPFYGRNTMGTGVRGATRLHLAGSDAQQMALVLEDAPQLAAHRRIVAPVAKAPANVSPAPFGFERGQVFATDQPTVIQQVLQ